MFQASQILVLIFFPFVNYLLISLFILFCNMFQAKFYSFPFVTFIYLYLYLFVCLFVCLFYFFFTFHFSALNHTGIFPEIVGHDTVLKNFQLPDISVSSLDHSVTLCFKVQFSLLTNH